jgi:hypothetical protein
MKRGIASAIATCALASGALGQGLFQLDNSNDPNGFALDRAGNWYTGGGGIEVWEANRLAMRFKAPGYLRQRKEFCARGFLRQNEHAEELWPARRRVHAHRQRPALTQQVGADRSPGGSGKIVGRLHAIRLAG